MAISFEKRQFQTRRKREGTNFLQGEKFARIKVKFDFALSFKHAKKTQGYH